MSGGFIALVFVVGTAVAAWYLLFGRTQMLKKQWTDNVLSQASALGAEETVGGHYSPLQGDIVKKDGFFSFRALQFPGTTATRAYVMNGVPVEPHIASKYSFLNTNDWMTIVQAQFPSGQGVEFFASVATVHHSDSSAIPLGQKWDGKLFVFGDDADRIRASIPESTRERLVAEVGEFGVISGGKLVTFYAQGVVANPQKIKSIVELANELATAGA